MAAFAALLQDKGRLLALDVGSRTIGLAVADTGWQFASPVRVLHRTRFTNDARELLQYAASEDIFGFVIGLPLNMDGTQGKRAQASRAFASNLSRLDGRPILLFDERLSTFEGKERAVTANAGVRIDHHAAAVFLEGALKALAQLRAG